MEINIAQTPNSGRINGIDVARGLAIAGMTIVHFGLVGAKDREGAGIWSQFLDLLDGRPAAMFMILAGIGLALMSQRASQQTDPNALADLGRQTRKRGVVLLVIGYLNLLIWPGDILRVYGIAFLLVGLFLHWRGGKLLSAAGFLAGLFVVLVLAVGFGEAWNWDTLTYRGLWTLTGSLQFLFYDGFRSVLPWMAFLLIGLWLGHLNLRDGHVLNKVLIISAILAITTELISGFLTAFVLSIPDTGMDEETIVALFGTRSIPALPFFLCAAGATACFIIAACIRLAEILPRFLWIGFANLGRLALTWYFAHIIIGLGSLEAFGFISALPLTTALLLGIAFIIGAILITTLYLRWWKTGPLEAMMRKVTR